MKKEDFKVYRESHGLPELPSKLGVGDPCRFFGQTGHVRAVIFTFGKVRYSVTIAGLNSTLHNVDGAFVEPIIGEWREFQFYNYS